jgi:hypothetical protein
MLSNLKQRYHFEDRRLYRDPESRPYMLAWRTAPGAKKARIESGELSINIQAVPHNSACWITGRRARVNETARKAFAGNCEGAIEETKKERVCQNGWN